MRTKKNSNDDKIIIARGMEYLSIRTISICAAVLGRRTYNRRNEYFTKTIFWDDVTRNVAVNYQRIDS